MLKGRFWNWMVLLCVRQPASNREHSQPVLPYLCSRSALCMYVWLCRTHSKEGFESHVSDTLTDCAQPEQSPLVDIEHTTFTKHYHDGLCWPIWLHSSLLLILTPPVVTLLAPLAKGKLHWVPFIPSIRSTGFHRQHAAFTVSHAPLTVSNI